jgi:hypothetical protein
MHNQKMPKSNLDKLLRAMKKEWLILELIN